MKTAGGDILHVRSSVFSIAAFLNLVVAAELDTNNTLVMIQLYTIPVNFILWNFME